MHIGIIGPPQSGKTTLFQALSALKDEKAGGRRSEPTRAVVKVPDPRVDALSEMFQPRKTTYATVEYMDVPHPGGSEAYPKPYMQNFRNADALAIVLRMFAYPGEDPETRRREALDEYEELALAFVVNDLDQVERKLGLTDQPRAIVFHEKDGRQHARAASPRRAAHGRGDRTGACARAGARRHRSGAPRPRGAAAADRGTRRAARLRRVRRRRGARARRAPRRVPAW